MGKTSLKQTDEEVAGAVRAGRSPGGVLSRAGAAIRDFLLRGGRLTKVAGEVASYAPSVGRASPSALAGAAAIVLGAGFGGAALTGLTASQAQAACTDTGTSIFCTGTTTELSTDGEIVLGTDASFSGGDSSGTAIDMTSFNSTVQTLTQSGTEQITGGHYGIRHFASNPGAAPGRYGGVAIHVRGTVTGTTRDGIRIRKGQYGTATTITAASVVGGRHGINLNIDANDSRRWTNVAWTGTVTGQGGDGLRFYQGDASGRSGITVAAASAAGTQNGIYLRTGNTRTGANNRYVGSISMTVSGRVTGGAQGAALKARLLQERVFKITLNSGAVVGTGGERYAVQTSGGGRLNLTVNSGAAISGAIAVSRSRTNDTMTFNSGSRGTLSKVAGVDTLTMNSGAVVSVGGSATSINKVEVKSGAALTLPGGSVIGSFTVGGGNFTGGGDVTLAADFSGATPNAQKLYVNGNVTGTTTINVSPTGSGATGEFLVVDVSGTVASSNFVAGDGYTLRYDATNKAFYLEAETATTIECSTGRTVTCSGSGVITAQVSRSAGGSSQPLTVTVESGVSALIPTNAASGSGDAFRLGASANIAGDVTFTQAAGGGDIVGQEHGINVTETRQSVVNVTTTGKVVGRTKSGIYVKRTRSAANIAITAASVTGGESGIHVVKDIVGKISLFGTEVDVPKGTFQIVATGLVTSSGRASSGHAGIRAKSGLGSGADTARDHTVTISAASVTSEAHGIWVENIGSIDVTATGAVTVTGTGTGNDAGTAIHAKGGGAEHVSTVKVVAGTGAGASFSGTAVSGRGHGIRAVLEDGTDAAGHNVTISAGAVTGLGGHGVYAKLNRKGVVSINVTGSVAGSGTNSDGIGVKHQRADTSDATTVSITAGSVSGMRHGIYIDNAPSKNVSVSVSGAVSGGTGANQHAIFAKQGTLGTGSGNAVQIRLRSGARVNGGTASTSAAAIRVDKSHQPTVTVESGAQIRGKLDFTGSTEAQVKITAGTFNAHGTTTLTGEDDLLELSGASLSIADDASISGGAGTDTIRFTGGVSEISNEGDGLTGFETLDIRSGATAKLGGSIDEASGATTVSGTLSMVDGETSSLTLGSFTGGGALALEADFSGASTSADTLYIDGNVTGTTAINVTAIGTAKSGEFLLIDVDPENDDSLTVTASAFTIGGNYTLRYDSSAQRFFANFILCSAGRNVTCAAGRETQTVARAAAFQNAPLTINLNSGFSIETGAGNAFSLTTSGGAITLTQAANGGDIVGQEHGIHLAENNFGLINVTTTGKVVGKTKSGIFARRTTTSFAGIRITAASVTGGESGIEIHNNWLDNAGGGPVHIVATGHVTSSGRASSNHAGIFVDSDNRSFRAADDIPVTVSVASVTSSAHGIWVENDAGVKVTATGSVTVMGTGTGNDAGTGIHAKGGQNNRFSSVTVMAGTGTGTSFAGSAVQGRKHGISAVLQGGVSGSGHHLTVSAGSVIGLGGHGIYAKLDKIGVVSVTATGTATGSGTDSDGISVKHESSTSANADVWVSAKGAVGDRHGIYVYNEVSRVSDISVSGTVSGGTGANQHAIFVKQKSATGSGLPVRIRLRSGTRVNGGTASSSAAAIRVDKGLPTVTIESGAQLRGKMDFSGAAKAEVKIAAGGTFNAHRATTMTNGADLLELSGGSINIANGASISGGGGSDTLRFASGVSEVDNDSTNASGLTGFETVEIHSGATAKLVGSALSISGAMTLSGTLSMVDAATGTLTLSGNLAGGGAIAMDLNTSGATKTADLFIVTGNVTGTTTITFEDIGAAGDGRVKLLEIGGTGNASNFTSERASFTFTPGTGNARGSLYADLVEQFDDGCNETSAGSGVFQCGGAFTSQESLIATGSTTLSVAVGWNASFVTSNQYALQLRSSSGIALTQSGRGEFKGGRNGIHAVNSGGSMSINVTGTASNTWTSHYSQGIYAKNQGSTTGDLTITTGDVSGRQHGIEVLNEGTGATDVTVIGSARADDGYGQDFGAVRVQNHARSGGISITMKKKPGAADDAVSIDSVAQGIRVINNGTGPTSITVEGEVVGETNRWVVYSVSESSAGDVTISLQDRVQFGDGVRVDHKGTGKVSVSVGELRGREPFRGDFRFYSEGGIHVETGGDISITVSGHVDSAGDGIDNMSIWAKSTASKDTTVTLNSGAVLVSGVRDNAGNASVTVNAGATVRGSMHLNEGNDWIDLAGGTITANMFLGAGVDTLLASSGTARGSVDLGAGDDRIEMSGGSLSGTLNAGAGTDTLRVAGGSIFGTLSGWETVTVESGAQATVLGSATATALNVSGTLNLNDGAIGDFDVTGSFTGGGTVAVDVNLISGLADKLAFTGNVTGTTQIAYSVVGSWSPGEVLVFQANGTVAAGALQAANSDASIRIARSGGVTRAYLTAAFPEEDFDDGCNETASGSGVFLCGGAITAAQSLSASGTRRLTVAVGSNASVVATAGTALQLSGSSGISLRQSGSGEIKGASGGIHAVNSSAGALSIDVAGSVSATAAGSKAIYAKNEGSATNELTITAGSASGAAMGIEAINEGTGAITVTVSGRVAGSTASIKAAPQTGKAVTVTLNSGAVISNGIVEGAGNATVTVNTGASVSGSTSLGAGADRIEVAGGTVAGTVSLGAGADMLVVTSGTASGSVDFGAGGDQANVTGRFVSGTLNAGAGADTLSVRSGATIGGTSRVAASGWETITVESGAAATLSMAAGNATMTQLTVAGTLDVADGANTTLDISGGFAGGGVLVLDVNFAGNSGDKIDVAGAITGTTQIRLRSSGGVSQSGFAFAVAGTSQAGAFTLHDTDGYILEYDAATRTHSVKIQSYSPCTETSAGSGVFVCAGDGDGRRSTAQSLSASGNTALSVTLNSETEVDAFGTAFTLSQTGGNGGITFTQSATGQLVQGTNGGIVANNTGGGAVSISVNGSVVGGAGDGISASDGAGGAGVTIAAASVTGSDTGIEAFGSGTGAVAVSASGAVMGTASYGIYAKTGASGGAITLTAAAVTGGKVGIKVSASGSGAVSVNATGAVTGSGATGIGVDVVAGATAGTLTVSVATVTGGAVGVKAVGSGANDVDISASGAVAATGSSTGVGIDALSASAGDITITAAAVTGSAVGIKAVVNGSGAVSVKAGGNVAGTGTAGIQLVGGANAADATIDAAAVAGKSGIDARQGGTGKLDIKATGTVTATTGMGIYGSAGATAGTLTITAEQTVTGSAAGIRAIGGNDNDVLVLASGAVSATATNGVGIDGLASSGGDLTITAMQTASGGGIGIKAISSGAGSVSVKATGTVTGTATAGVQARGGANTGTMTISVATVTGAGGIDARHGGTGKLDIKADGAVMGTGTGGMGIYGSAGATAGTLTITAGQTVTGSTAGIKASGGNDNDVLVLASGAVSATANNGVGIDGLASSGGDLTITAMQTASGGGIGIKAISSGAGSVSVNATGAVTGTATAGVQARGGANTGTMTISVATVTGAGGIDAQNTGSGLVTITATGTVTGSSAIGILGSGGGAVTITAAAVAGGTAGIRAFGSGAVNVNASAEVTATGAAAGIGIDGKASGAGALTITAAAVTGSGIGIKVVSSGAGTVSISATGEVKGTGTAGIQATGGTTTGAMTINVATVTGKTGIEAKQGSANKLDITATGAVTGTGASGAGIDALVSSAGALTITAAAVTGSAVGIKAVSSGAGTISVRATGEVKGTGTAGIQATGGTTTGAMAINAATVTGKTGIEAKQGSANRLNITATGAVTGTGASGVGIDALVSSAGALAITAAAVTGSAVGIKVISSGAGAVSVRATGAVLATGAGGIGVQAQTSGGALTISAAAVTGTSTGIKVKGFGTGSVSISASGAVKGTGSDGIFVDHDGSGATTITVTTAVTGGNGASVAAIRTEVSTGGATILLNSGASVGAGTSNAIMGSAGSTTVTVNTGASIAGKVKLGGGTDTLTFSGGTFSNITGLDGGDGTGDTLTFGVSGSLHEDVLTDGMKDWERIVVETGKQLSVDGAGTLVAGTGTLTVLGTLNLDDNPKTIRTLNVGGDFVGGGTINLNAILLATDVGSSADKLVIEGNVTGVTVIKVDPLRAPSDVEGKALFADVKGSVGDGAFVKDGKYRITRVQQADGRSHFYIQNFLSGCDITNPSNPGTFLCKGVIVRTTTLEAPSSRRLGLNVIVESDAGFDVAQGRGLSMISNQAQGRGIFLTQSASPDGTPIEGFKAQQEAIYAKNSGGGRITVSVRGSVTSTSGTAIHAQNEASGSGIVVSARENVSGAEDGIWVHNKGSGDVEIDAWAVAAGANGHGIYARNDGSEMGIRVSGSVTGGSTSADTHAAINTKTEQGGLATITIRRSATVGSADGVAILNDSGRARIVAQGTILGTVNLGAGDDEFVFAGGNLGSATVTGGVGRDTLGFRDVTVTISGGDATVSAGQGTLNAGRLTSFENVSLRSGATLSGAASFGVSDDTLILAGGRFDSDSAEIDGGSGSDEIVFAANAENFSARRLNSWETVTVQAGSSVSFLSGQTLNTGRLNLSGGSVLDLSTPEASGTLALSGDFAGGGTLAVSVDFAAGRADRLTIGGSATGATTISIAQESLTKAAELTSIPSGGSIEVVSVGGTVSEGAFALQSGVEPITVGSTRFSLSFDAAGRRFVLSRVEINSIGCARPSSGSAFTFECVGNIESPQDLKTDGSADLTVSAPAGLNIRTSSGTALTLREYGAGGVEFTQAARGGPLSGSESGIRVANTRGGHVRISATGKVTGLGTGTAHAGIAVASDGADVSVTAREVVGGQDGIRVAHTGVGDADVTVGSVTGTGGAGVDISNSASGNDVSVRADSAMGGSVGVRAAGQGYGAVSVVVSGLAASVSGHGIHASNSASGSGLSVSAGTVTGGGSGILAIGEGRGTLSVSASGTVSGASGHGIDVVGGSRSRGLSITAAAVSGADYGVRAVGRGRGGVSVLASDGVVGGTRDGIFAQNSERGNGISIVAAASASGGAHGIRAIGMGSGAVSISASGKVEGRGGSGIHAEVAAGGGALVIAAEAVSGAGRAGAGVFARNSGAGALRISTRGPVAGADGASGIHAFGGAGGVTVQAASVSGEASGVRAETVSGGALDVVVSGTVSGLGTDAQDAGIRAAAKGGALSVAVNGSVSGANDGVAARNDGAGSLQVTVQSGASVGGGQAGIRVSGAMEGSTEIVAAGSVSGTAAGVHVRGTGSGSISIVASSAISGGVGIDADATGAVSVSLRSGASVSGSEGDAIRDGDSSMTVTLHTGASISGSVSLGKGDDELNLAGGSYGAALLDGGEGRDTIRIGGEWSTEGFERLMARIENWDELGINRGGEVSLLGAYRNFNMHLDLGNGGTLSLKDGKADDSLTVVGDFKGGGAIAIDADLAANLADTLTIHGAATGGPTAVRLNDVTPDDAKPSGNGILLITVRDGAADDAFRLEGSNAVAGAFTYALTPREARSGKEFHLGVGDRVSDTGAAFRAAAPALMGGFARASTLATRNVARGASAPGGVGQTAQAHSRVGSESEGVWLRFFGDKLESEDGGDGGQFTIDSRGFQAGWDLFAPETASGDWVLGLMAQQGSTSGESTGVGGTGRIEAEGFGFGIAATWYGLNGTYLDMQSMFSSIETDYSSDTGGTLASGSESTAGLASLEFGRRFGSGQALTVVPQAQISWSEADGGSFSTGGGIEVDLGSDTSLVGRLGMAVEMAIGNAVLRASGSYAREMSDAHDLVIDGTRIQGDFHETWMEVGLGVSVRASEQAVLFLDGKHRASSDADSTSGGGSTSVSGSSISGGLRWNW